MTTSAKKVEDELFKGLPKGGAHMRDTSSYSDKYTGSTHYTATSYSYTPFPQYIPCVCVRTSLMGTSTVIWFI